MTDIEINLVLCKYDKVICNAINKMNLSYTFLANRCITKDDLLQEVRISLWKLLKNKYDPEKLDIKSFLDYQAAWNARMFLRNLKKSARCFTGSKNDIKKSGSIQARIDDNKIHLSTIDFFKSFINDNDDRYLNNKTESSYLTDNQENINKIDNEIDYSLIINNILKKMIELNFTEQQKNIFLFIVDNIDLLNDEELINIIHFKFKMKNIFKTKALILKIKKVIKSVLT